MLSYDSKQIAGELFPKAVEYRRHFHKNPELSFQEVHTAEYIRARLKELGIPMLEGISGNSVAAVINGGTPGPNVAFRADIDALPITETGDKPYCSVNPGVMHACGHDAHTAILLCLAEALAAQCGSMRGKVTLLFQQAEEHMPGGALGLIEDGALNGVDVIFGLHMTGQIQTGTVSITYGPRMASVDSFKVKIHSTGGHGSFPQITADPITTAAAIIQKTQLIVTKKISPMEPLLVNICGIRSNTFAGNIIPSEVELAGMVRCFSPEIRSNVKSCIQQIVDSECSIGGCEPELKYVSGYPALINTERETDAVDSAAKALGLNVEVGNRTMGSDDFARYLEKVPGCYFFVGCGNREKGIVGKPHTPDFDLDEDAMKVGLACLLETYKLYTASAPEEPGK